MLDKVRAYIDGQEEHHTKTTFMQEYDEFVRKYDFKSHG
jgi:hypothetical protein